MCRWNLCAVIPDHHVWGCCAQAYLVEELFFSCTNERLFKISRQDDPPFYTASVRKPACSLFCEDAWTRLLV